MESSEIQKRIINLGKALVEELGLDPGVDTLARWMAHYVAEQMAIAENATGDDKIKAEQNCFETILKLWQHRLALPDGRRPFESFEPIFRALKRLDPENETPYFYNHPEIRTSELTDSDENLSETLKWLDIAQAIDQAARVWLEYVFQQAILSATDEKTISWLENASGLPSNDHISKIAHLLDWDDGENEETADKKQKAKQEKLRARIKQLDTFIDFSHSLRTAYVAELEGVLQNETK